MTTTPKKTPTIVIGSEIIPLPTDEELEDLLDTEEHKRFLIEHRDPSGKDDYLLEELGLDHNGLPRDLDPDAGPAE